MRKSNANSFDYYKAYSQQAGYAHELACNLVSAVSAGELGSKELMDAMHTIENDADQVNHEIHARLMADFTTPLERDGMDQLAHALDDVCDELEDIAMSAYCFHCSELGEGALSVIKRLPECTESLSRAVDFLGGRSNWKGGQVKECLLRVQELESACDLVYIEALHDLYGNAEMDPEQRRIAHAMLDALEAAMDACENASESIFSLMTNNL